MTTSPIPAVRAALEPPSMTPSQRKVVNLALIGTLLLGIVDMNIVTSAGTSIGAALDPEHGVSRVPWLVTAYVLASSVVQPLYGKLADRHGVRAVFLITVGLFLAGSMLCGLATSMGELIAFRVIQGLGGGGLMSVTFIAIGHLVAESGQRRGATSTAGLLVGLGLVVGPLLGGFLVAHASWRWVFFVNLPLGGLAWVVVARNLTLSNARQTHRLDAVGAALLSTAAACVLLVCEWAGQRYAWDSVEMLGVALVGVAAALGFVQRQRTAPEPFFPPRLLQDPTLRVITALQFVAGIGLASAILYMTLVLQLVHHASPIGTGLRLLPLALGLAAGATIGASVLGRGGSVRLAIAIGQAVAGTALIALSTTGVHTSAIVIGACLTAFGAGLGTGLGNELILVQTSAERHDLGMATAGMRFVETIGAAIGASGFGLLFATLTHRSHAPSDVAHAASWVFALGGLILLVAALIALRLPDTRYPRSADLRAKREAAAATERSTIT